MMLANLPINKKTLLVSAIALSLTLGGLALSGTLSRQKSAKTSSDFEQVADMTKAILDGTVQAHQNQTAKSIEQDNTHTQSVRYLSLEEAHLSPTQKQRLARQIKNLQNTGSTSGGVLTTEFKSATHAKMSYRFGRKQPLSFDMTNIKDALPSGFVLTGREYEGVMGNAGFDGVYRLFENPNTKALFEITETYIHPDKPLMLIQELYRENLDGTPLRFEQLMDKKGQVYYHGEFVVGNRYVSITSRNLNLPEFMKVAKAIVAQTKNTP